MADKAIVDKAISDLTQAVQITNEDLFVLEQSGEAKKLKGSQVVQYAKDSVAAEVHGVKEYADSAKASADAANASATKAAGAAQGIDDKVASADASAKAAASSAVAAADEKVAAQQAQSAAEDAQQAAETAKAGAESEKTAAESARDAAGTSAAAAAGSAATAQEKATEAARSAAAAAEAAATTANQPINQITDAEVGQIIKVLSVGEDGKPTSYETVKMPGHWETVLEKIWDEPCIHPTAFDAETKTFTCDVDEIAWMELNKNYRFTIAPQKSDIAYDTRMVNQYPVVILTRTGDTTLTTSQTILSTFDFANWHFTRTRCIRLTGLNTKKIRVNLSGKFLPPLSKYETSCFGAEKSFAQYANGYMKLLPAYEATLQMELELIAPFTIGGPVICCANGPSSNSAYHFKNNSVTSMIKPESKANDNNKQLVFSASGDTLIGFYTTQSPWLWDNDGYTNSGVGSDAFELCAGTYVKIEQWVED